MLGMARTTGGREVEMDKHKCEFGLCAFENSGACQVVDTCKECDYGRLVMLRLPKIPREHYNWGDLSEEERAVAFQWFCTSCDSGLDESFKFCPNCGQKIRW